MGAKMGLGKNAPPARNCTIATDTAAATTPWLSSIALYLYFSDVECSELHT